MLILGNKFLKHIRHALSHWKATGCYHAVKEIDLQKYKQVKVSRVDCIVVQQGKGDQMGQMVESEEVPWKQMLIFQLHKQLVEPLHKHKSKVASYKSQRQI